MNVLINLLPDIRLAKQREKTRRQLFTGVAILVWGICGAIIVVLGLSSASQKLLIDNKSSDITAKIKDLKNTAGLIDALTAQEHLASLPGLYSQRSFFTNFLKLYPISDPTDIQLSSLNIDKALALTISGSAKSYASVTKLVAAMSAANVTVGASASPTNTPYYSNVTITAVSGTSGKIGFSVSANVSQEVISHGNN